MNKLKEIFYALLQKLSIIWQALTCKVFQSPKKPAATEEPVQIQESAPAEEQQIASTEEPAPTESPSAARLWQRLRDIQTPIKMPAMSSIREKIRMPKITTPGIKLTTPSMPSIPEALKVNLRMQVNMRMPQMPKITTPGMPSMPSIPEGLKTPGKYLKRPTMPNIDISKSIESAKGYMPSMPKGFQTPVKMPTFASIKEMKVPSAQSMSGKAKGCFQKVWNGIQVLAFLIYSGIIDGIKKYVLTKDAIIVVLYSWIGIILRNAFYTQEVHNWSTKHSQLYTGATTDSKIPIVDSEVSPISLLPVVNSRRFAMIILIIFNKLNRHDRGLITAKVSQSDDSNEEVPQWKNIGLRVLKMKYIIFDLIRCLMKDLMLSAMLHGNPMVGSWLYDDVKFVAATSLAVNHLVKVPSWYKRQSIIWSLLVIEYQAQLACSLLLIMKEGQAPKYAGPLGGFLCMVLLALEVFMPLLPPYIEELLAKGDVNNIGFLLYNRLFWLAPLIAVPFTIFFSYLSIKSSTATVLPTAGILELNNISGHSLTYRVWNSVGLIYGQIGLLVMLPYLCDVRKEYKKAEEMKQINDANKKVHEGIDDLCYEDDLVSQYTEANGPYEQIE